MPPTTRARKKKGRKLQEGKKSSMQVRGTERRDKREEMRTDDSAPGGPQRRGKGTPQTPGSEKRGAGGRRRDRRSKRRSGNAGGTYRQNGRGK